MNPDNIEITENAGFGLLIALASALSEQGDSAARRKLMRHLDARIDAMTNGRHPVWTSLWNPTDPDRKALRDMRRWLRHQLEAHTFPHP